MLWQDLADLDGDGTAEPIALTSAQLTPRELAPSDPPWANVAFGGACGEECSAVLRIDGTTHVLRLALRDRDHLASVQIGVIDLDPADDRQEILIRQQVGDDESSWSSVDIFWQEGGQLGHRTLWSSTWPGDESEAQLDPSGGITLRFISCGQTTVVRWERRERQLVKTSEETVVSDAEECAG